ncbi:hypothetical protein MesoLj113a_34890 [Mesorhizobium sp. 113-1-2]|uniref:hypothetical protein n=1 Tax=Mesorhizobium sp. 113-1-2 TaxID=2744515 RepID=UPI000819A4A8|nr:hypothetical protein [Mesorhizobium sp. 113-1-2]BAV46421.1 Putative uncharacterized protein [Mesorhizobium loti]BCG72331.1 hypothetical protein MesoLj113a_34890 [Mesorhizobium sp. 113-1-2]
MLSPPPRDDDGDVIPHDHAEILPGDTLIRRVNPIHHVVSDDNRNCRRLSSKLMKPQGGGMSVDHERSILEEGKDPVAFVRTPVYVAAVQFQAQAARAAALRVGYDPIEGNAFHCEVWGAAPRADKFTGAQEKTLLNTCGWYIPIEGVEIR